MDSERQTLSDIFVWQEEYKYLAQRLPGENQGRDPGSCGSLACNIQVRLRWCMNPYKSIYLWIYKREYFHDPANLSHVLMYLILLWSHLMVGLSSFHIKYVYNLGRRENLQFINRDTLVRSSTLWSFWGTFCLLCCSEHYVHYRCSSQTTSTTGGGSLYCSVQIMHVYYTWNERQSMKNAVNLIHYWFDSNAKQANGNTHTHKHILYIYWKTECTQISLWYTMDLYKEYSFLLLQPNVFTLRWHLFFCVFPGFLLLGDYSAFLDSHKHMLLIWWFSPIPLFYAQCFQWSVKMFLVADSLAATDSPGCHFTP